MVKEYKPRPLLLIFVDILTLLPVYEVFLLLHYAKIKRPESEHDVRDYSRMKTTVRLYRVYIYLDNLTYQAGFNQLVNVTITQIIRMAVAAHLLGAILYFLSCYKCDYDDWTVDLFDTIFDPEVPAHWFAICFVMMCSLLQHNWKGK